MAFRSYDILGWLSSLVLIATILTQVKKQWETESTAGISKWLYIGQITASAGFIVYSIAIQNWVFVATNTFLLLLNVFGIIHFVRCRRSLGHP